MEGQMDRWADQQTEAEARARINRHKFITTYSILPKDTRKGEGWKEGRFNYQTQLISDLVVPPTTV